MGTKQKYRVRKLFWKGSVSLFLFNTNTPQRIWKLVREKIYTDTTEFDTRSEWVMKLGRQRSTKRYVHISRWNVHFCSVVWWFSMYNIFLVFFIWFAQTKTKSSFKQKDKQVVQSSEIKLNWNGRRVEDTIYEIQLNCINKKWERERKKVCSEFWLSSPLFDNWNGRRSKRSGMTCVRKYKPNLLLFIPCK